MVEVLLESSVISLERFIEVRRDERAALPLRQRRRLSPFVGPMRLRDANQQRTRLRTTFLVESSASEHALQSLIGTG